MVDSSHQRRTEYIEFLNQRRRILQREIAYLRRNLNQRTKLELENAEGGLKIIEDLLATSGTVQDTEISGNMEKITKYDSNSVESISDWTESDWTHQHPSAEPRKLRNETAPAKEHLDNGVLSRSS